MAKYLHLFETEDDFQASYNNFDPHSVITALTVTGGTKLTSCDDWENMEETDEFNGRYTFLDEGEFEFTACGDGGTFTEVMKRFTDGTHILNQFKDNDGNYFYYVIANLESTFAAGDGQVFCDESSFEYDTSHLYGEPWVSYTMDAGKVTYNRSKYFSMPFTIEALESGTFNWYIEPFSSDETGIDGNAPYLQYSINGGEWKTFEDSETVEQISAGDLIRCKGNMTSQLMTYWYGYSSHTPTIDFSYNVMGNIMSLSYCDKFNDNITLNDYITLMAELKECHFAGLFEGQKIVSAKHLVLPSLRLNTACYRGMFSGCTSLIAAPELPATTLAARCYTYMFSNCTSLTTAPELPATTLDGYCYSSMFRGCTSLTKAPELPATTLAYDCYSSMFAGCSNLTTAPALPATTLENWCYQDMFDGCTSLTKAPALPATTLVDSCYARMFSGCTALTSAPALPVTTLTYYCYEGMFADCASLTSAPELPATTLESGCYARMFQGCTSLTQAPELPATTLASSGYSLMFNNCTSLTTAPELPATTLVGWCYNGMFQGCTSINHIKCLATDISASNCTKNWVNGVSSTGTFVKNANMSSWTTGTAGIPAGWTVEDA